MRRYDFGADVARSIAVSPAGSIVFVTGQSAGLGDDSDITTIAYGTATGSELWISRYNGPGNGDGADGGSSIVVSPDGRSVFVAGQTAGTISGEDYTTIAYDAFTGVGRWLRRYNGPGNGDDNALAIAISPDGGIAFVTGRSIGSTGTYDFATLAYAA